MTFSVAYCAPGRRAIAEMTLALSGETAEVHEHPYLEGTGSILLMDPEACSPFRPPGRAEVWPAPFPVDEIFRSWPPPDLLET